MLLENRRFVSALAAFELVAVRTRVADQFAIVVKPGPVGPVLPVGPVEPTVPLNPVGPVFPVGPAIPAEPVLPVGPVEPTVPLNPVGPVSPRPNGMPLDQLPLAFVFLMYRTPLVVSKKANPATCAL